MKRLIVLLCAVSISLSAAPVGAHIKTTKDRNDTRGKLDIRSVKVEHSRRAFIFTVKFHERFRARALHHTHAYVHVSLSGQNIRIYDAILVHKRRLAGRVIDRSTGKRTGKARLTHPKKNTLKFTIKRKAMPKAKFTYGLIWSVDSFFHGKEDSAPNNGIEVHPM